MRLILLAACLAIAAAAPVSDRSRYLPAFEAWKVKYGRVYETSIEELVRFDVWISNAQEVMVQNLMFQLGESTFTMAMNDFADQTNDEFVAARMPHVISHNTHESAEVSAVERGASVPATQNWNTQGWVTPVKDQGQCGSCWSFSATGSLEGQHFNVSGTLVSLSEEQQVECNNRCYGCGGGWADKAFWYWINKNGANSEADYPYTSGNGQSGSCQTSGKPVVATMTKYTDIKSGSETDLENACGLIGPISVAIDASKLSFQLYKSGIYDPSHCSTTQLDHAVLTVGYNQDSDGKYWIVKNSWGTSWGQAGYIWMAKDDGNVCGIATDASYPTASQAAS